MWIIVEIRNVKCYYNKNVFRGNMWFLIGGSEKGFVKCVWFGFEVNKCCV